MVTLKQEVSVRRYIGRLRSDEKKLYAWEYFNWRAGDRSEEPARGGLSAMGAQAVRLKIDEILRDGDEEATAVKGTAAKWPGSIGG